MSYSGDAAEQVVRMSLETGEVAVKLAGAGAKQLAVLLYAILREQTKTKGKTRLTNMLRSGKELKVFAVKDSDLQLFCREAKKYGVLYCVLKDKNAKDGITDVMVRAEDASKINRIFERFDLATVDMAEIKSEIERSRTEQQADVVETLVAEQMTEQETENLLDALFAPSSEHPASEQGEDEFLSAVLGTGPVQEKGQTQNPTEGRVAKSRQSEPTSERKGLVTQGISDSPGRTRPSVRQELKDITAEQKERAATQRKQSQPTKGPKHLAPRKHKPKHLKER